MFDEIAVDAGRLSISWKDFGLMFIVPSGAIWFI